MIRQATRNDVAAMTSIYNEAVAEGGLTGDLSPVSLESRQAWFSEHQKRYAIFVIQVHDKVAGYVSVSPYRKGRAAFDQTAEISYFLSRNQRGQGLGKQLLAHGMDYARTSGFRVLVAILLGGNQRSIKLLERFGFFEAGRVRHAACIGSEYVDHLFMSHQLADSPADLLAPDTD